jgi:hypothetical protein
MTRAAEALRATPRAIIECFCPGCRVIRPRPWLPRISIGLPLTSFSALRRTWQANEVHQTVATGGSGWEASGTARLNNGPAMNDRTAVFVRSFPVGKHTVTMMVSRRRFLPGRIICRWSPPKPARLTKEEKREYRSGRAAAVADAYGFMRRRFGLIVER